MGGEMGAMLPAQREVKHNKTITNGHIIPLRISFLPFPNLVFPHFSNIYVHPWRCGNQRFVLFCFSLSRSMGAGGGGSVSFLQLYLMFLFCFVLFPLLFFCSHHVLAPYVLPCYFVQVSVPVKMCTEVKGVYLVSSIACPPSPLLSLYFSSSICFFLNFPTPPPTLRRPSPCFYFILYLSLLSGSIYNYI